MANVVVPGDTSVTTRICNYSQEQRTLLPNAILARATAVQIPDGQKHCYGAAVNKRDKPLSDDLARQALVQNIVKGLPPEVTHDQRTEIHRMMMQHRNVFSMHDYDLGFCNIVEHTIETGDHAPVRERLRRYPPEHQTYIDNEVDKMLKAGMISPTISDWSANVVLAKKSDNSLRFAIDYRRLNQITKADVYPIPKLDSCLEALNGASWFSTVDLRSSFWQIAQSEKDSNKTTFVTRKGLFKFNTISFGLKNSTSLFQRTLDLILTGLTWNQCLVYVDDIIIFSRSISEHISNVTAVLDRLIQHNLKIKPSKSHFL